MQQRRPRRAGRRAEGQGLVEYAILLGLMSVTLVVALLFLGGGISRSLSATGSAVASAAPGAAHGGGDDGGDDGDDGDEGDHGGDPKKTPKPKH